MNAQIIALLISQALMACFLYVLWKEYRKARKERLALEAEKKREADRHRLHLCEKHNPILGLSNYAEHNCDYCKLLKKVGEA